MKRILLLASVITASFAAFSQDYAPVRAGDTAYFEDDKGYIQAIAISSVETMGADTVLIPFHQVRKDSNCYTPYGEHWLGQIVKKPGGEFLFIADKKDTLRILSNAKKGDSWIFRRKGNKADTAYLVEETIKTFLGVSDSVKVIKLGGGAIGELWLSKNYGFIKFPDVFKWPYNFNTFGFQYSDSTLKLNSFSGHNRINGEELYLDFLKIYGFEVGDEIHIINSKISHGNTEDIRKIKICEKIQFADDTLRITWKTRSEKIIGKSGTQLSRTVWDDVTIEKIFARPVFKALPGESAIVYDYNTLSAVKYMSQRKLSTYNQRLQFVEPDGNYHIIPSGWGGDSCWLSQRVHGCFGNKYYYEGLGGPYFNCSEDFYSYSVNLIYYKKGTETWGTPFQLWPVGEKEPEKSLQVTISPNPATEKVHIALEGAGSAGIEQVQLLNLQGKILFTQREKSSQNVKLNISSLAAGVYVVKIYSGEKTAYKKIVVAR